MSKVLKYLPNWHTAEMEPHDDGNFVDDTDYDRMLTQALGLARRLQVCLSWHNGLPVDPEVLQANPTYQAAQRFIKEYGE